jgi:hypothetical protein
MRKLARQSKAILVSERLTLYVKPQHRELVEWVQEYTQADSLSEAVFSALADLKVLISERRLQALAQTYGIWKGDPKVREAFKELEEGWEGWRKQLEGS